MARKKAVRLAVAGVAVAVLAVAALMGPARGEEQQKAAKEPEVKKPAHVPEVLAMLQNLTVDKPRTHKNMIVFPVRWSGKQAGGDWATMDEAVAAGSLKIMEKSQATVPEVMMENTGGKTLLLMSGEIIAGGRQTRVIRKDTVIEPKQRVAVAVFCVEQRRWAGGRNFKNSANMAPAAMQDAIKRGAGQNRVWREVRKKSRETGVTSRTESLDDVMNEPSVRKEHDAAHKNLGKFSPPDTVGIAVADARTGHVVGLELFGCRYLFEQLQDKLIEGYNMDIVVGKGDWDAKAAKQVTAKDIEAYVARALAGTSQYEDTPGSGRGIDLSSGTIKGKGVALGAHAIHLSIQDVRPATTPAKPIVNDRPEPRPPVRPVPLRR